MALSESLAALACARYAQPLADAVAAKARLHVADTVGISIAAAGETMAHAVAGAITPGAGGGGCTAIGSATRLAPTLAAFHNATLAHLLDFDDIHDEARLHPTSVTLPAALAAADLAGADLRAIVKAVALGNELMCRLGVMCAPKGSGPGADWFLTQLFGYFGAALAASLVLGATPRDIASAFGLAYMQAAGGKQAAFGVGSTARAIYPAFAAMGGVHAALLARSGVAGPAAAFDGDAGLFRLYLGGDPSPAAIAALLDPHGWHFLATEIKPWPCCRLSHPYVAAAHALRGRLAGRPVQRVVAAVNASAAKLCRPLAERRRPTTLQDAKYSIPFMIAFALVHDRIDLATLAEAALADAAVLEMAARVEIDERLADNPGHPPAEIRVDTAGGASMSADAPPFDVSPDAAAAKFAACLRHAGYAPRAPALWQRLLTADAPLSALVAECRADS